MILTYAVLIGTVAVLLRVALTRRSLQPVRLESVWLVALAFLPQWLAFHNLRAARLVPDPIASLILVLSQVLLLLFAWRNRRLPGLWLLGGGAALNFVVIVLNGGFMPIFPEVVSQLAPQAQGTWQVGERLWLSKDIVLPVADTHLPWLTDRFLMPEWSPRAAAFSLGDVAIALGTFRLLWSLGDEKDNKLVTSGDLDEAISALTL